MNRQSEIDGKRKKREKKAADLIATTARKAASAEARTVREAEAAEKKAATKAKGARLETLVKRLALLNLNLKKKKVGAVPKQTGSSISLKSLAPYLVEDARDIAWAIAFVKEKRGVGEVVGGEGSEGGVVAAVAVAAVVPVVAKGAAVAAGAGAAGTGAAGAAARGGKKGKVKKGKKQSRKKGKNAAAQSLEVKGGRAFGQPTQNQANRDWDPSTALAEAAAATAMEVEVTGDAGEEAALTGRRRSRDIDGVEEVDAGPLGGRGKRVRRRSVKG